MRKLKTTRWDLQDHLKTPEDQAGYLEAVLEDMTSEDPDPGLLADALNEIAKAKGMAQVAQAAALSPKGNPEVMAILKAIKALGLSLLVVPTTDERVTGVVDEEPKKKRATG